MGVTTGAGGAGTTGASEVTTSAENVSATGTPVTSTTGGGPDDPEPTLVTSGPEGYWVEGELAEGGDSASITVNESMTLQTWRGFGGTFNEMGWDALGVLDPAERDRAMRLLFSDTEGAGFDWGRIPIGASDYALERYTLAETPDDFEMVNFSIERDQQYLIPYIQAALAVKPSVSLWASPWSPPAWMKDSNNIDGTDEFNSTPTFESHMLSDPEILEAYALYFARFIEEYAAQGLTIAHIQPQNEPGYATRYPSCLWDTNLLGSFVGTYLGPTLEERGLDTEIWFGTLSNDATDPQMINGLTDAGKAYVKGMGLQWNTISLTGSLADQGYFVMQSEHKCGNYPWETATFNPNQPPNDHAYAEESWSLIKQWIEAGVHIYSAWNMVLDTQGKNNDVQRPWPQNALLVVDRQAQTLTATPTYHVFRHLSQFVDPGAVRLGTSGGDALAFKNPDSSIVAVVHNAGGQASATTLAVGGTTVQFTVPARGWATVNWQG
jgi:glucosylceramidase